MKPGTAIVGTQWGDEGKGKIVDILSQDVDVICRSTGGNNAGHTVVVGQKKTILHHIPSGILHPDKICIISNGVVINPEIFFGEIDTLEKENVAVTTENLVISDRAHIIMPYHVLFDQLSEKQMGDGKIGTTGRGIGPCYEDKAKRIGIRVCDFVDPELFKKKVEHVLEDKNGLLTEIYGHDPLTSEMILQKYTPLAERMRPFVQDTSHLLNKLIAEGKEVLYEGAQGTLLDKDHGTYPFVTSSNSTIGGIIAGSGVGPGVIKDVVGIVKAYTTRVGSGPFPTELEDEVGEKIRDVGAEFGSTTGRPRRCGWLDVVVLNFAKNINGLTSFAITKLDVLSKIKTLKICVAYKLDGKEITTIPAKLEDLDKCEPVYIELQGWEEDITQITSYDDLPANTRKYLDTLKELTGIPISFVSIGPKRKQTIRF